MAKPAIIFTILTVSIAAALYTLKATSACDCLNKLFFCELATLDLATEAAKWTLLRAVVARISLFIFAHAIAVMLIRVFSGKSNPAAVEDPTSIKTINRVISNTVEQSIVFVGLFAFFLFDKAGDKYTSTELMVFASWFLLSRVVFSVGYLGGSLIGYPNLRAYGFALNIGTVAMLIELSFCSKCACITNFFFSK